MLLEILYIIFGISVFGLFWTYAGYPIFIWFLSKIIKKEHKYDENYQPNVSIIIPCYNEEKVIEKKLKNTLELNYPPDKMEILVIDDGSKDKTRKIVENYVKDNKTKNINLQSIERQGKNAVINNGFKHAKNEIVVISDANAFLNKNALKYCLRHFSDEEVGCVGARYVHKSYISTGESAGVSLYKDIEHFFYEKENQIGCAHHTEGWLQAFRKNLLNTDEERPLSAEDWDMTLSVKKKKYKVIYEPQAISQKYAVSSSEDLFNQKIRTVIGTIQIMAKHTNFLNPLRWGIFSIIFFSNKHTQIMTPFFVIGIFFSSLGIFFLNSNILFYYFVILQLLAFFIGFLAVIASRIKEITIQPLPALKFFMLMQIICLIAWIKYFIGDYGNQWNTISTTRKAMENTDNK